MSQAYKGDILKIILPSYHPFFKGLSLPAAMAFCIDLRFQFVYIIFVVMKIVS